MPDVTFPLKRWDNQSIENMRYDVEKISWEDIGFVVAVVSDEPQMDENKPRVQLVWDPSQVISYHVTDETYRSDCWGLDFQMEGRIFAAKESEYIDRFKKLSPLTPDEIIHFTIIGTNTIVDLLVKDYPLVKKLK